MAHRFSFVSSRSLATLVAGCLASVFVTGCNDPELEKQAAYERQFNEVCASYATTMGGHPDLLSSNPSAESIAALRGVADRAKGLSGGTPVQQAAARKLAASVYRTAGSINLSRATSLESGEEVVRGLVHTANGIAADLEAIATAAEATDVAGARKFAEGKKAESQQAATAIAAASKQLEGPVANLDQQISASAGKIAHLNQDIAVLLRKARESSATAGLALVEEASTMRAEVRSLSKTMSNNAIESDALKSNARMASAAMREAQGMQDATKAAIDLLGSFKADIEGQAAKTRAMAADLRKQADAFRKALADERAGALKSAYEAAAKDFADAASDGEGDAFKQTIACEELRLRVSEVSGLGAQGRMLASTGGAGAAGLGEIKTAAEAAIAALKEKAGAAADMFANAGEDPSLAGIKTYVDGVKKMADGLTVDALLTPPAAEPTKAAAASKGSSGRSMSGAAGAGSGSNDDLDALVARFAAAGSDPVAATDMFVDLIDDSNANSKAMKGMIASSIDAMKPLIAAMAEKFGASAMGKGGAMAGGLPGMASPTSMGKLTKKSNDGSTAVYTTEDGKEINFVKTSSGWKLDMLAGMEPAQAEMMAQAAPMMGMMIGPMKKAAADVAARVKAGEFATAEEAQAAVQQAIMKAAGGAMGGGGAAGRGPRGGRPAGAGAPGGAGVEN